MPRPLTILAVLLAYIEVAAATSFHDYTFALEFQVNCSDLVARGTVTADGGGHLHVRVTETIKGPPVDRLVLLHAKRENELPGRRPRRDDNPWPEAPPAEGPRTAQVGDDLLIFAATLRPATAVAVAGFRPLPMDGRSPIHSVDARHLRVLTRPDDILDAARAAARFPATADWMSVYDLASPAVRFPLLVVVPGDDRIEELALRAAAGRTRTLDPHVAIGVLGDSPSPRGTAVLHALLADTTQHFPRPTKWCRGVYPLRTSAARALAQDARTHQENFPHIAFDGPPIKYRPVGRPAPWLLAIPALTVAWLLAHHRFARARRRPFSPLRSAAAFCALATLASAGALGYVHHRTRTETHDLSYRRGASTHSIALHAGGLHYTRVAGWHPPSGRPHDRHDWQCSPEPMYARLSPPAFHPASYQFIPSADHSFLGFSHTAGDLRSPFDSRTLVPYRALRLPLYLPIALLLIPSLVVLKRALTRLHRRRHQRCPDCGYDLRATPAHCPECGHTPVALPA